MYIARFSYDVQPVDRQQAIVFIEREIAGAPYSTDSCAAFDGTREQQNTNCAS